MQGISIFKQTYAAGASRVVMGFDSAINTYSPYAIGCIVGKSYAMAAAVVDEYSDQWHIVNLNTKHGFDAVAVLGAIDEDEAASIAMRDFGRFKESAMWDSVIATNTGGLKRYIDSPLCVRGRKVFTGEIGAMQDMVAGQKILWDGIYLQSHQGSSRVLLSDIVQHDDESALVEKFDGLNAWLAESDVEVMEFDALVVENYRLEQTMAKLASAMGAASGQGGVSVTNVTQTKAVKLRNSGAIQVGVSFELSDGQAVTAIFNHADSETQKLGLKDTLFSWKWKLNSRDISAAVQPNNFENVKLNILAGRIMKLVNANSPRFQRSQAKKLENEQALADGNARIAEKKATIESLKSEIESLHIQADELVGAKKDVEPEQNLPNKLTLEVLQSFWRKANELYTDSNEKQAFVLNQVEQYYPDVYDKAPKIIKGVEYTTGSRRGGKTLYYISFKDLPEFNQDPFHGKPSKSDLMMVVITHLVNHADEKAEQSQAENPSEAQPQHYSEKIIAQLIAAHGWTKAATTTSAKKEFAGLDEAGLLSDGGRIVYATFDEAQRYLRLQLGFEDVLDMDMRPYGSDDEAIADGAKEFNAKVEAWVLDKRGVGVAAKDGDERSNTNDINIAVSMLKEIYLKNIMIFNQDINDIDAALANPKDTLKKAYYAVNGYTIIDVVNLIGKSTLEEWDKGNQLGYIANQLSLDSLSSKQVAEKFKSENKPLIDELEQARRALIDKKSAALASLDVVQPQDAKNSPIVLTGKELGDFPDTAEGKKQLRAAADDLSMETKISKQDQGVDMSKAVAPVAQEIDIVNLEEMGVVQITDQGSENIYFDKDGQKYYAKVPNTEDYPVGEFDLSKYPLGLQQTPALDPAPATNQKDADLNYIKSVIDGSVKADTPDSIKDLNDQLIRISMAQMTNPDDRLDGLLSRAIDIASKAVPNRSATNPDAEYLNSIINGFNFAAADLDELESKLEAISERLTPETEGLFEQAAEAFAQYAISLEV